LELATTLGFSSDWIPTLKAFARFRPGFANAFSVPMLSRCTPRVVASSNPGLKLANAFGLQLANAFGVQLANALGVQLGDTTAFPVLSTPVFSKP
jgi:predicted MFS family arabinose efflux permease